MERHDRETDFPSRLVDGEALAGVVRNVHSSTWPTLRDLFARRYDRDGQFREAFDEWVDDHEYRNVDRDERFELAAKRYATHLATDALLSELGVDESPADTTGEPDDESPAHIGIDVFEGIPDTPETRRAVADLRARVGRHSLADVEADALGDLYEDLVPKPERKSVGRYYTPPHIAETIARWALPDDPKADGTDDVARVLDPASGSGRFLVEAYRLLARRHPERSPRELLDHLTAVDVDPLSLRLAKLNLATQCNSDAAGAVGTHHASFFDLVPGDDAAPGDDVTPGDDAAPDDAVTSTTRAKDTADAGRLGTFDAVVGNPPYVRQENLRPDAEHYRSHLTAFGPDSERPYYDGDEALSKKCDAYVYFVTHATQFLREGGRLGVVVPTKWLMTDYGASFQQFLFDHYELTAVVGFSARAFDDALVDAALLLARRREDEAERAATVTKFVRLEDELPPERIVDVVDAEPSVEAGRAVVETRSGYRVVSTPQRDVADAEAGKLAHFLTAPEPVVELVERPDLVRLGDVADVAYGNKTGANAFFFLDEAERERWAIDDRFLAPAIKSIRDAEGMAVDVETTDRYLLDVHDYVADVRRTTADDDGDPTERVKRSLARDGHDGLEAYVERGEREGYHQRRTCASRPVWFDLGDLDRPEILHPKFFDDHIMPLWNRDRLAPSNAVDGIYLREDVDDAVLVGILNSTVHKSILECWGRVEGGGALQLMTYEMETLPLVDPRALTTTQRDRIRAAVDALLADEETGDPIRRIDDAVLESLGMDVDASTLQEMHAALVERRVRNGDEPDARTRRVDETGSTGRRSFRTSRRPNT